MVDKLANPKGLTNDCQDKWKNWANSSIKAFFLWLKWQSNKPQNWLNVVETIIVFFSLKHDFLLGAVHIFRNTG